MGIQSMKITYRMKLFFILFISVMIILVTVSALDYHRLKEQALHDHDMQLDQATETVLHSLNTMDRAYYYLDQETALKMESNTYELQKKYEKNKDFSTWDFNVLAEEFGMDVYVLNKDNQIVYSNLDEEIGIDFAVCCQSLNAILHERREQGEIYMDGIDLEQQTGDAKKFSYMGTPDQKYLFELGYSLKNEPLFEHFNFLDVTNKIVDHFSMIEEMHVLNYGGLPFGEPKTDNEPQVRRKAFKEARDTNETVEVNQVLHDKQWTYRYVPYLSEYDTGSTQTKVVEIVYNNNQLDYVLAGYFKSSMIQLLIVLLTTGLALFVLSHFLSKRILLAYHDRRTKLKNRAAFDVDIEKWRKKQKGNVALFLMEVDNVQSVNKSLRHAKEDALLQHIPVALEGAIDEDIGQVYHFGDNEFAIFLKDANEEDVSFLATTFIDCVAEVIEKNEDAVALDITISVGGAFTSSPSIVPDLLKRANIALVKAKSEGKNQFQMYQDGDEVDTPSVYFRRG